MNLHYEMPKDLTEIPVRSFLRRQGVSLHLWRRLKHNGKVMINGEQVRAALSTLHACDRLDCILDEKSVIAPMNFPLDILYEDEHLLIVNKPAALLVHPVSRANPEPTLGNAVTHYYKRTGQSTIFHPMHRLDRNTTGIVVIAKQPHIQSLLTGAEGAKFHRSYLAICHGILAQKTGSIDLSLGRKPDSIIEQQVDEIAGKEAHTTYRVYATSKNGAYSLLALTPLTGRTHQLRVHFAAIGHPLLGDDLYGTASSLIARQALHACAVTLHHPVQKIELHIRANPPQDFIDACAACFPNVDLQAIIDAL